MRAAERLPLPPLLPKSMQQHTETLLNSWLFLYVPAPTLPLRFPSVYFGGAVSDAIFAAAAAAPVRAACCQPSAGRLMGGRRSSGR